MSEHFSCISSSSSLSILTFQQFNQFQPSSCTCWFDRHLQCQWTLDTQPALSIWNLSCYHQWNRYDRLVLTLSGLWTSYESVGVIFRSAHRQNPLWLSLIPSCSHLELQTESFDTAYNVWILYVHLWLTASAHTVSTVTTRPLVVTCLDTGVSTNYHTTRRFRAGNAID